MGKRFGRSLLPFIMVTQSVCLSVLTRISTKPSTASPSSFFTKALYVPYYTVVVVIATVARIWATFVSSNVCCTTVSLKRSSATKLAKLERSKLRLCAMMDLNWIGFGPTKFCDFGANDSFGAQFWNRRHTNRTLVDANSRNTTQKEAIIGCCC